MSLKIVLVNKNIKVGTELRVTVPKYNSEINFYRVFCLDVNNDSRGTVCLTHLKRVDGNRNVSNFEGTNRQIIVDKKWFDQKLCG